MSIVNTSAYNLLKDSFKEKGITMRDYNFYLDKAKDVNSFKSDLAINRAMGFKGSMASQLRNGKTHLSDEKMFELAKLADENPLIALIDLNIMRSDGAAKKSYEKIFKGIQKTAQTLSVAGLCAVLPSVAHAAESIEILTTSGGSIALTTLYIITFLKQQKQIRTQCLPLSANHRNPLHILSMI